MTFTTTNPYVCAISACRNASGSSDVVSHSFIIHQSTRRQSPFSNDLRSYSESHLFKLVIVKHTRFSIVLSIADSNL